MSKLDIEAIRARWGTLLDKVSMLSPVLPVVGLAHRDTEALIAEVKRLRYGLKMIAQDECEDYHAGKSCPEVHKTADDYCQTCYARAVLKGVEND